MTASTGRANLNERVMVVVTGVLLAACGPPPEYRVADRLAGLEEGASVFTGGLLVGAVSSVERRGETTFVRVKIARRAEALRAGDAVRTRRLGLDDDRALEIVAGPRTARILPPGAWLRLAPPAPDPRSELPPDTWKQPPPRLSPYQLLPPAPRPRRPAPPIAA